MALNSFSTALSGLNANAEALGVVGNNLANVNTVGFKASTVEFQDLVYQSVGSASENPAQVGLGTMVSEISPVFTQGTIESTGVNTNAAIQGHGLYLLNGPDGTSYTRAGNFNFDADGTLVTADNQQVMGYTAIDPVTGLIIPTGQPTVITVPPGVLRSPAATATFSAVTNLDANAPNGTTFTTSIQIFDSLGAPHVTTMTYTKTGTGAWSYTLTANGAEVAGGTPGTPSQLATGTLGFNGAGVLTAVNGGAPADVSITTPAWSNGATANTMVWDIVDPQNNPFLTGFASPSSTWSISQNGSAAGTLTNIMINPDGTIVASVAGGQSVVLAQLALAVFNNPQGLYKIGSNRFVESEAAGLASIGVPGTGGRGTLIGAALEQSNVDLAHEFTQMILAQRGYQANSKMITVSDQLLVDTLNMKQ